jgi:hypothetical protein
MKGRILISEEEKRRILQMHKSLLSEQIEGTDLSPQTFTKLAFDVKMGTGKIEVTERSGVNLPFTVTPTTAMTENSRVVNLAIDNSGIRANLKVTCVRQFDSSAPGGNGTEYKTKSIKSGSSALKNYKEGESSPIINFAGREFKYANGKWTEPYANLDLNNIIKGSQTFTNDPDINKMIQNYCSAMCGSSKTLCSGT